MHARRVPLRCATIPQSSNASDTSTRPEDSACRKSIALIERIREASLRKDYDDFLECLTDDVEYHYHVGSRPLLGKDWVRKFINRYEEIAADVVWRIDRYAESDDCLFLEGYEEYTDQRTGDRIAHPYMGIFEFRDGKVAKWRDYLKWTRRRM